MSNQAEPKLKIALLGEFTPTHLKHIEEALDCEIAEFLYTSGDDVKIVISHPMGSEKWYAWERRFGRGDGWSVWAESLGGLLHNMPREIERGRDGPTPVSNDVN